MATINDNSMDLRQYKGPVRVCEFCKPEATLLGQACPWCFAQGYLAMCLNCNGTGKHTEGAVWDGGKSSHTSTCTPCGGKGVYPARASDYAAQMRVPETATYAVPPPPVTLPRVVRPMPNLQPAHGNRR